MGKAGLGGAPPGHTPSPYAKKAKPTMAERQQGWVAKVSQTQRGKAGALALSGWEWGRAQSTCTPSSLASTEATPCTPHPPHPRAHRGTWGPADPQLPRATASWELVPPELICHDMSGMGVLLCFVSISQSTAWANVQSRS